MPYDLKKKGGKFAVVKKDSGETVPGGLHTTKEKAEAHLKALFANVKSTDNSTSFMSKEFLKCRASGAEIKTSQPWAQGATTTFCYMPAGVHTITAGFRDKAINITVNVHEGTAEKVQASFQSLKAEAPKQSPFGDIEHDEKEASFHPVGFSWGDHLGDQGVICSCEPTALGERNVNGKIHRSFSPSFATDADYSKAKLVDGCYTFPEGVRGSQSNPAEVIGIDFCVGTLTNKPAFRAMPPVKAKKRDVVKGGAPMGNRNAAKDSEPHHVHGGNEEKKQGFGNRKEAESYAKTASKMFGDSTMHVVHSGSNETVSKFYQGKVKASDASASDSIHAAEAISDMPSPTDSQEDYADLAKCAEFKTKVAEAHDEVFPDGEKHGKKFKLHNEAAMAHKAAAEVCDDAACRQSHQEAADKHLEAAKEHGKIIATDKAKTAKIMAVEAEMDMAKITAEESGEYEDAAKHAELCSAVANAHEEIYPDGEKHGSKFQAHSVAAEAHRFAAKLAGDNHQIELHSDKADEHEAKADEHANVKAYKKGGSADVVKAGGPGSGPHKKLDISTQAHMETQRLNGMKNVSKKEHENAAEMHEEAARTFRKGGTLENPFKEQMNAYHLQRADYHRAEAGKIKASDASASVLADLVKAGAPMGNKNAAKDGGSEGKKEKFDAAHAFALHNESPSAANAYAGKHGFKLVPHGSEVHITKASDASSSDSIRSASVLADLVKAKNEPVKLTDSKSILASLARAKSN
jgi:hypothetical protein